MNVVKKKIKKFKTSIKNNSTFLAENPNSSKIMKNWKPQERINIRILKVIILERLSSRILFKRKSKTTSYLTKKKKMILCMKKSWKISIQDKFMSTTFKLLEIQHSQKKIWTLIEKQKLQFK